MNGVIPIMEKYTIKDFGRDFPDDKSCLQWLANNRWPNGIHCPKCDAVTKHHIMEKRRSFSCQVCGHHVHPTAGTIFHKSPTPLTDWFYATFLMASTRCGISAKQIQRELGVTYKTAWRMCHLIRKRLDEGVHPLSGNVEIDETYIGGKRPGKRGRGADHKTAVMGSVERQGKVNALAVPNVKTKTIMPFIQNSVLPHGNIIHTDEFNIYNSLTTLGYDHRRVYHAARVYVQGTTHTNTIEGFWSLVKRGINGVYHAVSPKYLQNYLTEYSYRYNHRHDEQPMFISFLARIGSELE